MPSSSFPLLRLPVVALMEVIEKIEIKPLFKLSLCSKRMHFVVKNYRRRSPMPLELRGYKDYTEVSLFRQKYSEDNVTFGVRAEGDIYCWETDNSEEYQSRFKETERLFSCENIIKGTKFLVKYLCDLFAANVKEVKVAGNTIWMLHFVEERQGAFSYDAVILNKYEYTDEQLKHILLDLNPRSLVFYHQASDEFRIENFHKKYENLKILGGIWMTVENLCQLDCVTLGIDDKNFSNTEINRYFKHVLSGGAPRLRVFSADVHDPTENLIMDGIQELLTGSERFENGNGNWEWNGNVAREEGLMLVNIEYSRFGRIFLSIRKLGE